MRGCKAGLAAMPGNAYGWAGGDTRQCYVLGWQINHAHINDLCPCSVIPCVPEFKRHRKRRRGKSVLGLQMERTVICHVVLCTLSEYSSDVLWLFLGDALEMLSMRLSQQPPHEEKCYICQK